MTHKFTCAQCETVKNLSTAHYSSFTFYHKNEEITVYYTLCLSCFLGDGLTDDSKERLKKEAINEAP